MTGTTKTRDRIGLAEISRDPSRVLAFGTNGSRVPGFDVIAISDIICFLPLAINNSDEMVSFHM